MKKYNLDPFTFGDSLAAQNLAKIINENGESVKLCGLIPLIQKYQKRFNQCEEIKDKEFKKFILSLVRDRAIKNIGNVKTDELIISHARNVMVTSYKKHLKDLNEN